MAAFYQNSIQGFLTDSLQTIQGILSTKGAKSGFYQQLHSQTLSWNDEIIILKEALSELCKENYQLGQLGVLLEYPIPRREKRIDVIIISNENIIVLEFKVGKQEILKQDEYQLLDYCLDIRDFHFESRQIFITPLLIATESKITQGQITRVDNQIQPILYSNKELLFQTLKGIVDLWTINTPVNYSKWDNSDYFPTPTIIEAARALYAGKTVKEISRSHAGTKNLTKTSDAVVNAIRIAKESKQKIICFITGIPGAGKTLAGLNIAHAEEFQSEGKSLVTFLSGNGPLIKVLREVLSKDAYNRIQKSQRKTRKEAIEREMTAFVENVHRFIDMYCFDEDGKFYLNKKPNNQIIIFDEAQRAWNAEQSNRKFKRPHSEAEMLLNIMNRHDDWAAIIALVGGGQEINSGEAGLAEWGRVLEEKYSSWVVYISPEVKSDNHSIANFSLFSTSPKQVQVIENSDLHLDVSLRSYKAEKLSEWVNLVLLGKYFEAKKIHDSHLKNYPIAITRNLKQAKEWLVENCKGTRRMGLIASSGGKRLRSHGIDVDAALKGTSDQTILGSWFLNQEDDVRSSNFLEVVSTEFAIQGLELDWSGLCWDADLRIEGNIWKGYSFTGSSWKKIGKENIEKQQFFVNKYRVLLTRAREGMIIWVPNGNNKDKTRKLEFYDSIFEYLISCGIKTL